MDLHSDALSWPVHRLERTLSNLLFYLEVPNAETTGSKDWLEKISAEINHDFQAVAISLTDAAESERVSRMRVEATHFANVLHANPGIRLSQWTESFPDCLPKLRTFQRELQAAPNAVRSQTPASNSRVRFTKKELCEMTGYNDGRVNARLKALGIGTTGGGRPKKGDKPFSIDQARDLLLSIIEDDGAQKFNKEKCQESLQNL